MKFSFLTKNKYTYKNAIVFYFDVSKLFAINGKKANMIRLVNDTNILSVLQHEQLGRIVEYLQIGLELSEQITIHSMHKHGPLLTSTNNEAKLTAHHHAHYLAYMTGEYCARTRILNVGRHRQVLVDDQTLLAIPDPDHDSGIAGARGHKAVAILGHFGAIYTRDQVVVAEYDLHDLGGVRVEYAEALVEEACGEYASVVVGDYEVVLCELELVVEVFAQLASMQGRVKSEQLIHEYGQLLLQLGRRLIGVY